MSEKKEVAAKNNKAGEAKKPGFFKRMWNGLKTGLVNMWREMKKVTWPKFPTAVKQTGVVLGVVLVFLIVITAFDGALQFVLSWITGGKA